MYARRAGKHLLSAFEVAEPARTKLGDSKIREWLPPSHLKNLAGAVNFALTLLMTVAVESGIVAVTGWHLARGSKSENVRLPRDRMALIPAIIAVHWGYLQHRFAWRANVFISWALRCQAVGSTGRVLRVDRGVCVRLLLGPGIASSSQEICVPSSVERFERRIQIAAFASRMSNGMSSNQTWKHRVPPWRRPPCNDPACVARDSPFGMERRTDCLHASGDAARIPPIEP